MRVNAKFLLVSIFFVVASFAAPAPSLCEKVEEENFFIFGPTFQNFYPNRASVFTLSAFPVGAFAQVKLGPGGVRGSFYSTLSGEVQLLIGELGYSLEAPTPFFRAFMQPGVFFSRESFQGASQRLFGGYLSLGVRAQIGDFLGLEVFFKPYAAQLFSMAWGGSIAILL